MQDHQAVAIIAAILSTTRQSAPSTDEEITDVCKDAEKLLSESRLLVDIRDVHVSAE